MRTAPDTHANHPAIGVGCALVAASAASLTGILLRHIEAADAWQILFWRSGAFALTFLLFTIIRYRRRAAAALWAVGWPGVVAAVCLSASFITFIFAMLLTTVAAAVFVFSTAPLIAALLGMLVLKERPPVSAWLGISVMLPGMAMIMADGLLDGAILGYLMAIAATLGYSGGIVALRKRKHVDMVPTLFLAGILAMGVSGFFVDGLVINANDFMLSILLGIIPLGFQYLFITLATKYVSAAEVTLLMLSEAVLSPLWVWLGVGETPGLLTLLGGAIMILAVCGYTITVLRQTRKSA